MPEEAELKRIFSRVLHIKESEVNPSLSQLNTRRWDSITHITLIAEIERAFKMRFTNDEVMQLTSFGAIVKTIGSNALRTR